MTITLPACACVWQTESDGEGGGGAVNYCNLSLYLIDNSLPTPPQTGTGQPAHH